MRLIALPLVLMLGVSPAAAQDAPSGDVDEGFSLLQEGAKLLFRGLMDDMEPALDDMGRALRDLEPGLRDLMALVGDLGNYHPPERLPNGDILIRRKTPTEIDAPGPGEIDL